MLTFISHFSGGWEVQNQWVIQDCILVRGLILVCREYLLTVYDARMDDVGGSTQRGDGVGEREQT